MKKNKINNSNNKNVNIGIFLVAIIVSLIVIALFYPKYSEYQEAVATLEQINMKINKNEELIANSDNLQRQLVDLKNEIATKQNVLDENLSDGTFLMELSNIMKEMNVELSSLATENNIELDKVIATPINIEVRGNYQNVKKLVKYLEEEKKAVKISELKFELLKENKKVDSQKEIVTLNSPKGFVNLNIDIIGKFKILIYSQKG